MIIKVLGGGCSNCMTLADDVKRAMDELRIDAEIIKLTDFRDILQYDIMATPALVIDEKVISSGKMLKPKEIIQILKGISEAA